MDNSISLNQEWQNALESSIYKHARKCRLSSKLKDAIPDGIANVDAYLNTSPKVAWIGKEPYDEVDESREPLIGGWSLTEGFLTNKTWSTRTWQRVIYTMYSLRTGYPYKELGYIHDYPEMGDVMQSIAWINLSKMPGGTTSGDSKFILEYQKYWKSIVMEQLVVYNPDVIIFCNTLDACFSDFFPEGKEVDESVWYSEKECFIDVYKKGRQLLLNAYHPGRPMSSKKEEFYVDSLVKIIRRFFP